MAVKNFDEKRNGKKPPEGHEFTLGGKTFRTKGTMPPAWYAKDVREEGTSLVVSFVREMVVKEDRPAFDDLLSADDIYVDVEDVLEVFNWLLETITGRPTSAPVSSEIGREETSGSSEATPSGAATPGKT